MSRVYQQSLKASPASPGDDLYPEDWFDDRKMAVFMAEFRPRHLYPDLFDAKMHFWKKLIIRYLESRGSAGFSLNELRLAFKRKGVIPQCLHTVCDAFFEAGEIKPRSNFMEMPQKTWTGWAVSLFVKKPLKWSLDRVKETLVAPPKPADVEYVNLEVVNLQAMRLLKHYEPLFNQVFIIEDVLKGAESIGINEDGFDLVIHQLCCQDRVAIEQLEDGKMLVKFPPPGLKAVPIYPMEKSIFALEETQKTLLKAIDDTEIEIDGLTTTIKSSLRDGKKQVAKMHLKRRHMLEKSLVKRFSVLDNIQSMLARVHDAQKDKNVLQAYKMGTDALKGAFVGSGITLDSVDDALAEMQDVIETHADIQANLSIPSAVDSIDEDDLEKELAELLGVDENKPNINDGGVAVAAKLPKMEPIPAKRDTFEEDIERRLANLRVPTDLPELPADLSRYSAKASGL